MIIRDWGPFKINKEKFILEQEITFNLSPEDLIKEIDLSNLLELEETYVEDGGEWVCLFFSTPETPEKPIIVYAKVNKMEKAILKGIVEWNLKYNGSKVNEYPLRERPLTSEEVKKIRELAFGEVDFTTVCFGIAVFGTMILILWRIFG